MLEILFIYSLIVQRYDNNINERLKRICEEYLKDNHKVKTSEFHAIPSHPQQITVRRNLSQKLGTINFSTPLHHLSHSADKFQLQISQSPTQFNTCNDHYLKTIPTRNSHLTSFPRGWSINWIIGSSSQVATPETNQWTPAYQQR